jgi:hypothetical protein
LVLPLSAFFYFRSTSRWLDGLTAFQCYKRIPRAPQLRELMHCCLWPGNPSNPLSVRVHVSAAEVKDVELLPINALETPETPDGSAQHSPALTSTSSGDGMVHVPEAKHRKEHASVLRDGWAAYLKNSLHAVLFTSKMNILLLCIPFAFVFRYKNVGDGVTFVFALLALCPLAEVRVVCGC